MLFIDTNVGYAQIGHKFFLPLINGNEHDGNENQDVGNDSAVNGEEYYEHNGIENRDDGNDTVINVVEENNDIEINNRNLGNGMNYEEEDSSNDDGPIILITGMVGIDNNTDGRRFDKNRNDSEKARIKLQRGADKGTVSNDLISIYDEGD